MLVATIAATAFVAAGGVAVAENVTPFDSIAAFVGISSANHTDAAADALDPQSLQMIERWNEVGTQLARRSGTAPRLALPSTARLINQFPSGRRFYVVSTTTRICAYSLRPLPAVAKARRSAAEIRSARQSRRPLRARTLWLAAQTPRHHSHSASPAMTLLLCRL